jgi:hypothetical protein
MDTVIINLCIVAAALAVGWWFGMVHFGKITYDSDHAVAALRAQVEQQRRRPALEEIEALAAELRRLRDGGDARPGIKA